MADENESNSPEIPLGGANISLDMGSEKDRGLVRQALKNWPKRWRGMDKRKKAAMVEALDLARGAAVGVLDRAGDDDIKLNAAGAIASIVRTAAMIEGQNQKDEHHADDVARGKGTGPTFVQVNYNQCPPKRPPNLLLQSSSNGPIRIPHSNGSSSATNGTG